jgi:hypothetical protein
MLLDKLSLEPGEAVLRVVRKHWLVITLELAGIIFAAILPLLLVAAWLQIPAEVLLTDIPTDGSLITFLITTWLLLSTMSGFVVWTHYYLDLWVITDRRIIAVDQVHFFNRNVAIFRLERLQDIEFSINGLVQTFFNFGTISAQTAGHTEANFRSTGMPNPDQLQNIIQSAMDARLGVLNNRPNLSPSEVLGE